MSLTALELADLRAMLSDVGLSEEKQDDMIRVLDNIAKSWVDQAHGTNSIQLSLSSRANYRFSGVDAHATVETSSTINASRSSQKDSIQFVGPEGHLAP